MVYFDTMTYLPDDILTKVDRASMSVSLESRIPMLDHNLIEFVWSMPDELRMNQSQSKWALKTILAKNIPQNLWDRPKKGFGIPINEWLRGPLKEWAHDLLTSNKIREDGYFNNQLIESLWSQHLSGSNDWGPQLWDVLMFQSWYIDLKDSTSNRHP
jgi:asparagine synthase (glutamine-hydrolysing)